MTKKFVAAKSLRHNNIIQKGRLKHRWFKKENLTQRGIIHRTVSVA